MEFFPNVAFLLDEVSPQDTLFRCIFNHLSTEALIVTCSAYHIEQGEDGVKRVANDYDTLGGAHTITPYALGVMCFSNPDRVVKLALAIHSHLLQLSVQWTL